MEHAFVFGYGSLVNPATHAYGKLHPAALPGWRRVWRHVEGRSVAFLTVTRDPSCRIEGVIAPVPGVEWTELDFRERSYVRESATGIEHSLTGTPDIRFYHAPESLHRPITGHHPILLSYLDVVVQGYFRLGGAATVSAFFATTEGWNAPVLNDRGNPRYPRHQVLTAEETALADACLRDEGVALIS
jgi:hypothetical protein